MLYVRLVCMYSPLIWFIKQIEDARIRYGRTDISKDDASDDDDDIECVDIISLPHNMNMI